VLGRLFIMVVVFLPRGLIALAGRGAFLGVMIGLILADPFVRWVGGSWPKSFRVLLVCAFILLWVFVPRILSEIWKLVVGRVRLRSGVRWQTEA
jgi:hypothetical protein